MCRKGVNEDNSAQVAESKRAGSSLSKRSQRMRGGVAGRVSSAKWRKPGGVEDVDFCQDERAKEMRGDS